jgi:large subunit ribosomal protein L23Ae
MNGKERPSYFNNDPDHMTKKCTLTICSFSLFLSFLDKAKAVSQTLKKGISKKGTRIHTKVHFYRPKTRTHDRKPKYVQRSTPKKTTLDKYSVIKYPLTTESSMKLIEDSNTLVFITSLKSNKRQIKAAVKELYNIECEKVNTLITPRGLKKAYVRLSKDFDALDVANRVGVI